MNNDLLIKSADDNDIKILFQKWIDKCLWLNNKGLFTWNVDSLTEENLCKQYINPQYFVCYSNAQFVGGFILIEKDVFFWPEKVENDSIYLHKLLVCNNFNGQGYGKSIINWIKEYGIKNGKKYLRLDYFKEKHGLDRFYTENEFYRVDEVKYKDRGTIIKAEYKL